uniref:DUF1570 domain-containing protein n=1 Tax=Ignisphaera aggregans TaxID=334771 RepID=A0A7C4BCR8_9CREN
MRKLIRAGPTALYITVVGEVPQDFVSRVLEELVEAYRLFCEGPELVEVYIYGSAELMRSHLLSEVLELGVSVVGQYSVSHDAWRGWPRMHIDYGACKGLEERFLKALLHHEAAHSVLHGTLQSYVVALPRSFAELFERSPWVVYLASVAVKDVEVVAYLSSKGLKGSVKDYLEYIKTGLRELHCKTIEEVLEFAKLVAPCTIVECSVESELGERCREAYSAVLEVLEVVKNMKGDVSEKIETLVRGVAEVVTKRRSL